VRWPSDFDFKPFRIDTFARCRSWGTVHYFSFLSFFLYYHILFKKVNKFSVNKSGPQIVVYHPSNLLLWGRCGLRPNKLVSTPGESFGILGVIFYLAFLSKFYMYVKRYITILSNFVAVNTSQSPKYNLLLIFFLVLISRKRQGFCEAYIVACTAYAWRNPVAVLRAGRG